MKTTSFAQGIYYWKWFIKAAILECKAQGRDFCPVFPVNQK